MQQQAQRHPSTARRMILMLLAVGLLLGLLVAWNVGGRMAMRAAVAKMTEPVQTVSTMHVEYQFWQPLQSAVGSLRAQRGAELALEAGGILSELNLASGAEVQEGELLVQLRDTEDRAMLRQLEAAAALAELSFSRASRQLAGKTVSQADYDRAKVDLDMRRAAVEQQRAAVAKKQLRAPFAGRAGIVTLSPGAWVGAGTAVVSLQQVDPILADFFVPQRFLGRLSVGQRVRATVDAWPGEEFAGELTAIEPVVDASTRNARVEARLANPEGRLSPGMFARVAVEIGAPERRLTLPQGAIAFNPYGATVFIVQPGKADAAGKAGPPTAQQVFVTTGETRGDQVAIEAGLEEGAEVVTSGQLKLKNGTPLAIDNRIQPPNDPAPRTQEQ